jgi:hypothetical protein
MICFLSAIIVLGAVQNCNAMQSSARSHNNGYLFNKISYFTDKRISLKTAILSLDDAVEWAITNNTLDSELKARNDKNETPLMYAISINSFPAVQILLSYYDDIDLLKEALICTEQRCRRLSTKLAINESREIMRAINDRLGKFPREKDISDEEMAQTMMANMMATGS